MVNGKRAAILACVVTAAAMLSALGGRQAVGKPEHPRIFGSIELRSSKLDKFRKWTGVLARYKSEIGSVRKLCRPSRRGTCAMSRWQAFLARTASLPRREQIENVNAYFNKLNYIVDPVNYGLKDYWATPKQFFDRNGDCEDYAISKYLSLRKLGVAIEDLRIVVLDDLNLKITHAVLVVYFDGEALILDNQISQVINAKRIRHYKPIYSINERNWWLHRS